MMQDPPQAAGDEVKKFAQVESRDERIIHFEQHTQAIPLPCQLLLVSPSRLKVQCIIDGDRHLAGYLLHEINFTAVIVMGLELSKAQRSQPPLCGGQWNHTERVNTLLEQRLYERREGGPLGLHIRDDVGILSVENPPGRGRSRRRFPT